MWLNVQSDYKKTCLILKNLWTMRFWDLERIGANDSKKMGVMSRCVYIEKGGKCKISAKNNIVNRFTKCVNRFRQLNDKQDDFEDWYASGTIWIDSNIPGWRLIWFKLLWIDSIRVKKFLWYDSIKFESIESWKKENLMLSKFDSIQMFPDEDWLDSNA